MASESGPQGRVRYQINPVGFGIALAGALTMTIAVFLPRAETSAFSLSGIEQNTLIQNGDGWWFIVIAVLTAGTAYRSWQRGRRTISVMLLGALAIGMAIYAGSSSQLQLYRLDLSGSPNLNDPVSASAGVGIYAAGVGGLLALLGGWVMHRSATPIQDSVEVAGDDADTEPRKRCPDCAETVLAGARVCRYCGHQFDATPAIAP